MVKKYLCDYCGTRFAYSPDTWRRHVRGAAHMAARAEHYRQLASAGDQWRSEVAGRRPCWRLSTPAGCPFGDDCRFSHLSPEELERLRAEAEAEHRPPPSLADWLRERPRLAEQEVTEGPTVRWRPPPAVRQMAGVTPSLRPLEAAVAPHLIADWG
ncbi:Zinc finger matrin-type protein 5 [Amphibalanus amphitrite]|uniref:Zinc finger matrin-type protein 5 n=1 Tax=Amphibalanus amphitrite TaxID=1232801 RepID=A0A6A4WUT7_AMPAM|nr:Zinc finger matrin-type protein 5 [Amphibalanus amphitrite]